MEPQGPTPFVFYTTMDYAPSPEEQPPSQLQKGVNIRVFVKWEACLTLIGLIVCITFGVLLKLDVVGGWAAIWSPVSLLIGMFIHLMFMGYRLISYMTALIFEVAPAMRNLTKVMGALFEGRTTG